MEAKINGDNVPEPEMIDLFYIISNSTFSFALTTTKQPTEILKLEGLLGLGFGKC